MVEKSGVTSENFTVQGGPGVYIHCKDAYEAMTLDEEVPNGKSSFG